jgi:hypothetical protein
MDHIKLCRAINNIENTLSNVAFIPIIPGAIKVVGGATQLVAGIAVGFFASLTYPATKNKKLLSYSFTHIKNGAGNIVAGAFEAIPVVGAIIALVRLIQRTPPGSLPQKLYVNFGHHDKIMPYEELQKEDLTVENDHNCPTWIFYQQLNKLGKDNLTLDQIEQVLQDVADNDRKIHNADPSLSKKFDIGFRFDFAGGITARPKKQN